MIGRLACTSDRSEKLGPLDLRARGLCDRREVGGRCREELDNLSGGEVEETRLRGPVARFDGVDCVRIKSSSILAGTVAPLRRREGAARDFEDIAQNLTGQCAFSASSGRGRSNVRARAKQRPGIGEVPSLRARRSVRVGAPRPALRKARRSRSSGLGSLAGEPCGEGRAPRGRPAPTSTRCLPLARKLVLNAR